MATTNTRCSSLEAVRNQNGICAQHYTLVGIKGSPVSIFVSDLDLPLLTARFWSRENCVFAVQIDTICYASYLVGAGFVTSITFW